METNHLARACFRRMRTHIAGLHSSVFLMLTKFLGPRWRQLRAYGLADVARGTVRVTVTSVETRLTSLMLNLAAGLSRVVIENG